MLGRVETFGEREKKKKKKSGSENSLCPPLFYFDRVFIMLKYEVRFCSAELALVVMIEK